VRAYLKKAAPIAALVALFVLLLGVFVYYRYPWNNLKVRLTDEVSSHSPVRLKIGEIKPSVPVSLRITDIELYQKSPSMLVLQIDELRVDPSIWSLIFGKPKVKLKGYAYGGSFGGRIADTGEGGYEVEILLHGLLLDKYNWRELPMREETSVKLGGAVDFTVSGLADPKLKHQNLSGSVDIKNLSLLSSMIAGVELPDMTFPSVSIPFDVKNSQLTIKPTSVTGDKVDARLQGTVNLASPPEKSVCNLEVKLKLKGDFKESLDPLLQWVKSKDAEGFYKIKISGQLKKLKFR